MFEVEIGVYGWYKEGPKERVYFADISTNVILIVYQSSPSKHEKWDNLQHPYSPISPELANQEQSVFYKH